MLKINHLTVDMSDEIQTYNRQIPDYVVTSIGEKYCKQHYNQLTYMDMLYDDYADRIEELYNRIDIPIEFTDNDPYDDYADMRKRVNKEEKLYVFSGGSNHKYLTDKQNLKGRAVHDFFGHLLFDVDFSIEGEFLKWYHMARNFYKTDVLQRITFQEVVYQRMAIDYVGGFDYSQYPCLADISDINICLEYMNKPVEFTDI